MTHVLITDYEATMSWIKRAYPYIRRMKEGMEKPLMVAPEMYDELCDLVQEAGKWMVGKSDEAKNEYDKKNQNAMRPTRS